MNVRGVEAVLWCVAMLAGVGAVAVSVRARPKAEHAHQVSPILWGAPEPREFDARVLSEAASAIPAADPFRLERRPAAVAYGTEPSPPNAMTPSLPGRPMLSVSGIIGGPSWEAILDGIPGREGGVLVRAGQVIGELRIRTIRPDTVIVEGSDTTWILTLRRPWR